MSGGDGNDRQALTADPRESMAGECRLNEHELCHGNVDLNTHEHAIPVPLLRCACPCHKER